MRQHKWWVLVFGVCVAAVRYPTAVSAQRFESVAAGVEVSRYTRKLPDSSFDVVVVRIQPALVRVRVVAVYRTLSGAKQNTKQYYVYNLAEVARALGPIVAINGGFASSLDVPLPPVGLLMSDGLIISPQVAKAQASSGVFCVGGDRPTAVAIIPIDEYKDSHCIEAIQAGPIVVQNNEMGILERERKLPRYRRSVIAIDSENRIVLIATGPAHLYDVANMLMDKSASINAKMALNLSGESESGVIVSHTQGTQEQFGNIGTPIASAVVVSRTK
jgi:uncharacterized protein YigE (DUF2233 family)